MTDHGRTAIVMSRLPRLVDPHALWLRGLRAALRRIQEHGGTVVRIRQTAGSDFIQRGAERLGLPVDVIADGSSTAGNDASDTDIHTVRDRRVMSAADTVLVLGIRAQGNIHRALVEYLASGGRVELVDLPGLQPSTVRDELIRLGASTWPPSAEDQAPFNGTSDAPVQSHHSMSVYEIVPFPPPDQWVFLSHSTRACPGPWPHQSFCDYADSLLDELPDADHSASATLARIVAQRRVISSPQSNRGQHPVVCLTEVPLMELPLLRQYQVHRTRWDFEPFGVCVDRDWLQSRGARPVIYGDEATWLQLSDADRPYFQLCPAQVESSGDPGPKTDWRIEREWRHVGDLDLQHLPRDKGLVFVPTFEVAMRLAGISPWPLTLAPAPIDAI